MVLAKGRSSHGRPCREVLIKTTVEDLPNDPARSEPLHFISVDRQPVDPLPQMGRPSRESSLTMRASPSRSSPRTAAILRLRHGILPDTFSSTNSTRPRSSLLARMRISARFLSRSWVSLETRRYPTVLDGFSGTICSRSMKTPLSLINDIVSFDLFNAMHCTISKPETFVFSAIPWNGFSHAPNAHTEHGRTGALRTSSGFQQCRTQTILRLFPIRHGCGTGPAQPRRTGSGSCWLTAISGRRGASSPRSNIMSATLLLFPVWSGLLPMCFPAKLTRKGPVCTIRVAFSICQASGLSKLRPKTS